ncbi:MAG: COX15/CtaA family protein [Myxococcaceae bacterium]|nr:COX15/CtaA family protein [Myxococcaceae bacterium]MCI0670982.1 COX15/CtaA family protein [Myxococcaceae bacterium]
MTQDTPAAASPRFRRYAWGTLLFTLGVVAWGAFVRATKSGAGCGDDWPHCNGHPIPLEPTAKTLVEYLHRLTSGVDLLLCVGLLVWAVRTLPRRHPARTASWVTLAFMLSEAAVGAALVKFRLVVDDDSLARAVVMCIHLVNTFGLLGALALTAWWAEGRARVALRSQGLAGALLAGGLLGILLLGVTGALTALGDTLFPAQSLRHGLAQDFAEDAHALLQLRVLHPVLAIVVGVYLVVSGRMLAASRPSPSVQRASTALAALFGVQLLAGVVNLVLLAPVWMQLLHLLLADAVWLAFLFLGAACLAVDAPRRGVLDAGATGQPTLS